MLDPISRGTIVALSMACVVSAVALAPLRARSSLEAVRSSSTLLAFPMPDDIALEPIRRNPFALPAPALPTPPGVPPVTTGSARAPVAADVPLAPLPGNLADDTIPALPGTQSNFSQAGTPGALRVTAVVTGAHPYAMVLTAGVHEIKGLGDSIAGSRIVSIDLSGIRLQNGVRLPVDAAGQLP